MKKKMVFPGEFLTTAEEYVAGRNTFEDESGNIYSSSVGLADFNTGDREVDVSKSGREVRIMNVGTKIYGIVTLVKDSSAVVQLFRAEKDDMPATISVSSAVIPISKVSTGYVTNIRDKFKIGDVVYAVVDTITQFGVDLATASPEFGVVRAYCTKCRSLLGLFGSELKCTNCGQAEQRKLSTHYMQKH